MPIVKTATAPLRRLPSEKAPLETEALHGEEVRVLEPLQGDWCRCRLAHDGYEGWLPASSLQEKPSSPTHKVGVLRTFVYESPDIKTPSIQALSFLSRLWISSSHATFAITREGHYLHGAHLVPIDHKEPDFVAVAERFLRVPYLWGGRTALGIDCSGLVQVALAASGIEAPRDSGPQEAFLGEILTKWDNLEGLRRGDLVFWKGHVGLMTDHDRLIHASGHHMQVVSEPLRSAIIRIEQAGSSVTSVKRLTLS